MTQSASAPASERVTATVPAPDVQPPVVGPAVAVDVDAQRARRALQGGDVAALSQAFEELGRRIGHLAPPRIRVFTAQ